MFSKIYSSFTVLAVEVDVSVSILDSLSDFGRLDVLQSRAMEVRRWISWGRALGHTPFFEWHPVFAQKEGQTLNGNLLYPPKTVGKARIM